MASRHTARLKPLSFGRARSKTQTSLPPELHTCNPGEPKTRNRSWTRNGGRSRPQINFLEMVVRKQNHKATNTDIPESDGTVCTPIRPVFE